MALKAKTSGFRSEAADGASRFAGTPRVSPAAGAIRIVNTLSPEKAAEQKSAVCSPNAFLRWVLMRPANKTNRTRTIEHRVEFVSLKNKIPGV